MKAQTMWKTSKRIWISPSLGCSIAASRLGISIMSNKMKLSTQKLRCKVSTRNLLWLWHSARMVEDFLITRMPRCKVTNLVHGTIKVCTRRWILLQSIIRPELDPRIRVVSHDGKAYKILRRKVLILVARRDEIAYHTQR